jgi:FKBP-type peptidyl-prolyl cis-trans isomerase 2
MIRNFLLGEIVEINYQGKVEKAQIWDITGDIHTVKIETEEGDGDKIKILEHDIIGYPGGEL